MSVKEAIARVLPRDPITTLEAYRHAGGGRGIDAARRLGPAGVVDEIEASGLRGRGGAGFPTGTKWRTVAAYSASSTPATVVANGAEGEPGTFKDRALIRNNPFAVVEGALIAALAVGADRAVIALKASFGREQALLRAAIDEVLSDTGWSDGVGLHVIGGPDDYLFGEETGLLEALDGRPPFPRIAPPFRHGVDEVSGHPGEPGGTQMAQPGSAGPPPALVNNVETLANVSLILAEGPQWFRTIGTAESPGSILCTVSGATNRHGVGEVELGTTLADAIEYIGAGPRRNRRYTAALSGVANPIIPADRFDTPLTYEDMQAMGSGLGAAGFTVFDDHTDLAAVAAGVSRFLGVESCGQCTPCKRDGLELAELLRRVCAGEGTESDLGGVLDRVRTVSEEARCFLASQHELVLGSILRLFPDALRRHVSVGANDSAVEPEAIVPIVDIVDGKAELDLRHLGKQPDWSYDEIDSGRWPVQRLAEDAG